MLLIFSLLQKLFHQCNLFKKKHMNLFTVCNHLTVVIEQCQFGFQVSLLFSSCLLKQRPSTITLFWMKCLVILFASFVLELCHRHIGPNLFHGSCVVPTNHAKKMLNNHHWWEHDHRQVHRVFEALHSLNK